MGKTFVEKVLARASGQRELVAGQIVDASPDVILTHDNTAAISRIFRALGRERVQHPERRSRRPLGHLGRQMAGPWNESRPAHALRAAA